MTEATYRVIWQAKDSYRVEVSRPGLLPQTAAGFGTKAEANAWVAQDKRLRDAADPWRPPAGRKSRGYTIVAKRIVLIGLEGCWRGELSTPADRLARLRSFARALII